MEGKFWCFTLNNWSIEEFLSILDIDYEYLCVGAEIGDEGTPHLQGYIEFTSNWKMKRLFKINERIHWERRKGSGIAASDYCKKEEVYFEDGYLNEPEQGKRTDLDAVRLLVNDGGRMKDIVMVARSPQSVRMAELMLKYCEKKRNWLPDVYWFYGPTGSGKTKAAFDAAGDDYWVSAKNLKWWEGYDANEVVIIDDFRKDFCTFHELLRLLDRYEYRIECKGGSRQLLAKKIFITSCYPPEYVYDTREDIGQLLRRLTKVIKFKGNDELRSEIEVGGNTKPRLPKKSLIDNLLKIQL